MNILRLIASYDGSIFYVHCAWNAAVAIKDIIFYAHILDHKNLHI